MIDYGYVGRPNNEQVMYGSMVPLFVVILRSHVIRWWDRETNTMLDVWDRHSEPQSWGSHPKTEERTIGNEDQR